MSTLTLTQNWPHWTRAWSVLKGINRKRSTTIRFDEDVLEAFKATGPGWQSRMNAALKEWLASHSG